MADNRHAGRRRLGRNGKLNNSIMEAHDFLYYGRAINEEEGWILDQREKELGKEAEDADRALLQSAMSLRKRGGKLGLGIDGDLLIELCRMWSGLERSQASAKKRRDLYAEFLCGDLDWDTVAEGLPKRRQIPREVAGISASRRAAPDAGRHVSHRRIDDATAHQRLAGPQKTGLQMDERATARHLLELGIEATMRKSRSPIRRILQTILFFVAGMGFVARGYQSERAIYQYSCHNMKSQQATRFWFIPHAHAKYRNLAGNSRCSWSHSALELLGRNDTLRH